MDREVKIARSTIDGVLNRCSEIMSTSRKTTFSEKTVSNLITTYSIKICTKNRGVFVRDGAEKTANEQGVERVENVRLLLKEKTGKYCLIGRKIISMYLILDEERDVNAEFAALPGPKMYGTFDGEFF
jgi:hypothetical protein